MRTQLLVSVTGFGLLLHVAPACGGPALDDFEHDSAPPELGGTSPVAIGNPARGGSAGRSTSSRGGATHKGDSWGGAAAGGGAAASPSASEPEPSASSGGAAPSKGGAPSLPANGGRATTGGRVSSSGGVVDAGGAAGSSDAPSGGGAPATGGVVNDPQGGAPPQASGGQAGLPSPPETGGMSSSGGESSGGAPVVTEPPERTLWFSEYVEGSGNLKALEVAALDEQSSSGCQIEVFANGESDSPNAWKLETPVAPAAPLVVCTEELHALLGDVCLKLKLTFNGDDAVVLRCDGLVVDAIGQVGFRPDKQWGEGELRTLNMTLRRACSVGVGDRIDSDVFDPALEWQAAATDDFTGLGTHCAAAP